MSAADKAAQQAARLRRGLLTYKCMDCGRVFDLLNEDDTHAITHGHACKV